jgi:hypothetical protein
MPVGAYLLAAACFAVAALSLFVLARFGWLRTTRAAILALGMLLVFSYWQASRAEDMHALALIASATLMILPAFVGSLAGAFIGTRRRPAAERQGRL